VGRSVAALAVGLLAVSPLAATEAAKPKKGGSYRGKTSQDWKVSFKVSSSGKRVKAFASSVTLSCDQGGGPYTETRTFLPPGSARVRKGGRFSREVSPGDGTTYKYKGRFTSRRRAKGTLTMGSTKLVFGGLEVCVTLGTVRWKAKLKE
jgi:hypothetical protein